MRKVNFAIWITTLGLLVFVILCSLPLSIVLLQLCFFLLTGSLIWMVVTILKEGDPSVHSFDERFYEDEDLGPRQMT